MKRSSKRRDRVKYVDPVTGLTAYRYVEKVTYRYEDEEKAKAYDKMIGLAEECFNIPIRKRIWHQTVSLLREECPRTGIGTLSGLFGYSRQSFYCGLDPQSHTILILTTG